MLRFRFVSLKYYAYSYPLCVYRSSGKFGMKNFRRKPGMTKIKHMKILL